MSTVPPNPAQGKALFEGTQSFYAHDDAADNKNGGVYSHLALEWSANEAEALCDWARYINALLTTGTEAVKIRNETGSTLPVGPVKISGYSAAEDRHLVVLPDADGSAIADLWLSEALTTATNGVGYTDVAITGGIDTSTASAVGDPVYLSATGTWTLTAPTGADQAVQIIGAVKVKAVDGTIAGRIFCPKKFGTSWLQDGSVTAAKIASLTSAQLATILSDETGTGSAVFNTSPTLAGSMTVGVNSVATAGTTTAGAATDHVVVFTGTTTQTYTLPACSTGRKLYIKNRSTGVVTVNRAGSDTIDGDTTYSLSTNDCLEVCGNGTDWVIL